MICYGFGDLASQFVWTYVGTYLSVYYTDVVGLAPAAVSAIMIIARLWDAVNDPMMGAIAERTRSRFAASVRTSRSAARCSPCSPS